MSFSGNIKDELTGQPRKMTCCKKAFVYGLLINSEVSADDVITFETEHEKTAQVAENAFEELFRRKPDVTVTSRIGHRHFTLRFVSHNAAELLRTVGTDTENEQDSPDGSIEKEVNFRCENCRVHFLRGAFLAAASVNDPLKSYHLEFTVHDAVRAKKLYAELNEAGFNAKIASRRGGTGLYFKESTSIEDILTYIGAATMIFECMNDKILRDIRNDTNRRANCETRNIERTVKASQGIIAAIKKLDELGLLAALPDDLKKTADLRLNNPEASLSEICLMFEPPLSKSGLSHRLEKIRLAAEKAEKMENSIN